MLQPSGYVAQPIQQRGKEQVHGCPDTAVGSAKRASDQTTKPNFGNLLLDRTAGARDF